MSTPASLLLHALLIAALFLLPGVASGPPEGAGQTVLRGEPEAPPPLEEKIRSVDPEQPCEVSDCEASVEETSAEEPEAFPEMELPHTRAFTGMPPAERPRTAPKKTEGEPEPDDETGEEGEGDTEGDSVLVPPVPLYTPDPEYPSRAQRRGWEGTVILRGIVTCQGCVTQVTPRQSSGYDILDKRAIETFQTWRFKSALLDGKPVDHEIEQTFIFELK